MYHQNYHYAWVLPELNHQFGCMCINNEEAILLETCKYDGPDKLNAINITQVTAQAMTGEIFRETFPGTEPRECSEKRKIMT